MFRRKRLAAAAAAVVVGLAVGLTACSAHPGATNSATSGTLTIGAILPPHSFAANNANWANESIYEQAAYDTLLHADAKTGAPLPWLATSWAYNAAKTVVTFKLRSDVKFSDGTKFDATAAAENILRFQKGTDATASTLANVTGATAINATTLQVTLAQPDPAVLSYLSQAAGLEESPKAFTSATVETVPVGSGPYIMDTANTVIGSKYVFTANPNYFAKEQQHFAKLVILVYSTATAALNAIKGKQVDGVVVDPSTESAVKASGYTLATEEAGWQGLVLFDRGGKQTPALGDVRVRQAMNYAIDKAAILKAQARGLGTVTTQVFATYLPGYDASLDNAYPYNPAKAKALLQAAGYSSFTLNMPVFAGFGDTANALIKQNLNAVGINVTYTTVPVANLVADLLAPKYSATFIQLQQDPGMYQAAQFLLTPTATFNPYHYTDSKVVAWVKTIQTGSQAEADTASKALGAYIVAQAWNVPFYRAEQAFAVGPKINAISQPANPIPYLYYITPKK